MSLPTQPSDLAYPPGDSGLVRSAADHIRSTVPQLRTARTAAVRIEGICEGAHWRGDAFDAFCRAVEVEPLPQAIDHARSRMEQAAERLEWFAGRFDDNTATIRWCRSRLAAFAVDGDAIPDELVPELQRIQWDAERAWDDHRAALAGVADLFDWLDDQPSFATPPPSNWDRVRGAAGHVWRFGAGIADATWEMVTFSAELSLWLNPATGPLKWNEAWDNREQIGAVFRFARDNPRAFLSEFGKAMIDLDALRDGGVAYWLGRRVPDVVLAIATGGLGTIGTGAAISLRGVRGARAAASVARRFRFAAKPTSHLRRFSRADSAIGRLAAKVDRMLPSRVIEREFAGVPFIGDLSETGRRRFDSLVTGGLTGRLGVIDGLAVGARGSSTEAEAGR